MNYARLHLFESGTFFRPSLASAFGLVLLSRIILFGLCALGLYLWPFEMKEGLWQAFPDNIFLDGWARWDSGWYASIVNHGYVNPAAFNPDSVRNTPFFPLYPITIGMLNLLTAETYLSGILVANACFLACVPVLYRLVRERYGDLVAFRTVMLVAAFPYSFYFNAMYAESLFLLLVLLAFYMGERNRWLAAGIFAALAGATRHMGVVVLLGLSVLYLEKIEFEVRRLKPDVLFLGVGALGPLAYMVYLYVQYGDPFDFVATQSIAEWAYTPSLFPFYHPPQMFFLIFAGLIGLMVFEKHLRFSWAYVVWAAVMCGISYWKIGSFGRLAIVIFPCFVVASVLLKNRYLLLFVTTSFLLVLLVNLFNFSHWRWVA